MEGDLGWCCGGGGGSNNWDLHAVVRFAGGAPSSPPTADSFLPPPPPPLHTDELIGVAACRSLELEALLLRPPADEPCAKPLTSGSGGGGGPSRSKRKRKKSQVKKEVVRVPAGAPAPDPWAWRKYGQKPIKGSPYPRGYYRCSTDKDCKARKQAERCGADPGTLVLTYTGEHAHPVPPHRSSLAGTTRGKPPRPPLSPADEPDPQPQDPPSLSAADDAMPQGSPSASAGPSSSLLSVAMEYDYEDYVDADGAGAGAGLLLDDEVTAAADDALLFLEPEDPAPSLFRP